MNGGGGLAMAGIGLEFCMGVPMPTNEGGLLEQEGGGCSHRKAVNEKTVMLKKDEMQKTVMLKKDEMQSTPHH